MKIIFATHNQGKLKEMKELLFGFEVMGAEEAGIFEDVIEDGRTFVENALKKARFVAQKTGELAVADDSGICIEALDGAPGIMTARWAGEDATDDDKISLTLKKMKNISENNRSAYFQSVVALVSPDNREWIFEGRVDGKIANKKRGQSRPYLPYDLIFIPNGYTETFAEMSDEKKNKLSHRSAAFKKLKEFLVDFK